MEIDYNKVSRYFARRNQFAFAITLIVAALITLLGFFAEYAFSWFHTVSNLIFMGFGVFLFVFTILLRMTRNVPDAFIDKQYTAHLGYLQKRALEWLGLGKEIEESLLIFRGCYFRPNDRISVKIRRGADGFMRSSVYEAHFIFYNDRQLYIYKAVYSIARKQLIEGALEFFYQEVVSVGVSNEVINIRYSKNEKIPITFDQLEIVTAGGNLHKCSLHNVDTDILHDLNVLRWLVRSYKPAFINYAPAVIAAAAESAKEQADSAAFPEFGYSPEA
ncbi:MAG: hypothetical protein FWE62_05665 [Firmicutes bacterium]|nr:hypothetical protein [Bacillota bacterium]